LATNDCPFCLLPKHHFENRMFPTSGFFWRAFFLERFKTQSMVGQPWVAIYPSGATLRDCASAWRQREHPVTRTSYQRRLDAGHAQTIVARTNCF